MSGFAALEEQIDDLDLLRITGQIRRVTGLVAEADGLPLPVGSSCRIICRTDGNRELEAEVLGFEEGRTLLVPCGSTAGISAGDRVLFEGDRFRVGVARSLLGRVLDGRGAPIDGRGAIAAEQRIPIDARPIPPLSRRRIAEPLSTGVRAIDALLTIGRGQRIGIFSGSGVGKSILLGMLARATDAPVVVIGLIGERGREVREFLERDLGDEGRRRAVLVVATADESPILRLRAARVATAIAEWFRDLGEDVVLLLDSITRVAMAQRELGLSASEPPTAKAFPPSVFTLLPRLLERTGPAERGSITGFYSVLVEADDLNDPIGDAVRGILDGHIWLSRSLANRGYYPAIDVLQSVSRVMQHIAGASHKAAAQALVEDLARYRDVEDLLRMGAYVRGAEPRTDAAIDRIGAIEKLLRQTPEERSTLAEAASQLIAIYEKPLAAPVPPLPGGGGGAAVAARPAAGAASSAPSNTASKVAASRAGAPYFPQQRGRK